MWTVPRDDFEARRERLAQHQAKHDNNGEQARDRPEPKGGRSSPSLAARFEKPHRRAIPRLSVV